MDMIHSLKRRFIIITMTIVSLMLAVVFSLVLILTRQRLFDDNLRMLESAVDTPMKMQAPDRKDRGDTEIRLPIFRLMVSSDGEIVEREGLSYDLADSDELSYLVCEALSSEQRNGVITEYGLSYLRSPVKRSTEDEANANSAKNVDLAEDTADAENPADFRHNKYTLPENADYILVFSDVSSAMSAMRNLFYTCLLMAALAFLGFLVIAVFLAKLTVRPVEQAWIQQRQFVSDASHELKTPLTVILTNVELLQEQSSTADPGVRRFVSNILTMSQQMRGLVESLLELARVDNGSIQKLSLVPVDLSRLVEKELLTFEAMFYEKGLLLTDDIAENIHVKGSAQHLSQVVEILLDNAQKYADPHGTVHVALRQNGTHHALLSVADPGEEISDEDLKNIFKRFYRIDPARAMNHSYGLGLSIAQSIVENHRGRIWAESRDGINTFYVELLLA